MDLSSAVSAMSGGVPNGGSAGATACPVCTLYLREGISLQKHLDTHPKEQVIEALIRASSGAGGASALLSQACAPQPQLSHTPVPAPAPTPTPSMPPMPTPSPGAQSQHQHQHAPAISPSPHVPQAQSPYPIGPIFECPPINAMIPPPQFTSFSYQQFVNNGTMMIPAQYAMAQAQPPQASQMMQMLYSPFGMYHQQQIPTVQMISAPPMMPTATALPPTMPPAAPRMRPVPTTSNVTLTPINEASSTPSPPRPLRCSQQQSPQPEQQQQQQQLVLGPQKHTQLEEIVQGPSSILPDLEEPAPRHTSTQENHQNDMDLENMEQQTESNCRQEEEQTTVEQYHTEDPPMLLSNPCDDNTDDDKTERILPDIDDTQEIESLLIRKLDRLESNKNTEMQVEESIQYRKTSDANKNVNEEITEIITSSQEKSHKECTEKSDDNEQIVKENSQPQNLSTEPAVETQISNINKPEIEQINRLLVNIESEFSNVELTNKNSETNKNNSEEIQDSFSVEPLEKLSEEDESTSAYTKDIPEPIECKILLEHEDTDVSSIASDDSMQCDLEIDKIITSSYTYKYSQSLPTTPVCKKKIYRSLSRTSLRYDFDHSNENICSYPVGFEATSLQDYLKDNLHVENMELEEVQHQSYVKQNIDIMMDRTKSHAPFSTDLSCGSILKARRTKVPSSASIQSDSPYCDMLDDEDEDDDDDSEAGSLSSDQLTDKDDDEEDEDDDHLLPQNIECDDKKGILLEDKKPESNCEVLQQQPMEHPADFRTHSLMSEHYSTVPYANDRHLTTHQMQQQTTHNMISMHQETYPHSNVPIPQNLLNISQCVDPAASTDSKSYSSSSKSAMQKPTTELLNISEDAHAGPMNVFEFDGLQILVPSTFISESSQKAVSATSQQSMSSSENGAGNDEEVKSVNMRADETMPPRGELSEQESNGCTEQSAWQLYMGQESSRMSTSYDLMARESWEESEGSDHDDHNGGPLLDSRSLATHFTSSLFLDRDRKTPTRRIFKCSHCPEVFECPKERRVHSTMIHKEAGPSSCSNDNMDQPELKDIKLLDGRVNVFEDIFVPGGLHLQQAYQHHQQPLLHQLQPPEHSSSSKLEGDPKTDPLSMAAVSEVTCNLCNQRFSSEKSLHIHRRRVHITESVKRVRENAKCQICSEEFTSVASFNLHLKIHPLECGQCGKYFYRKQNFKLHMKRHLGIKPFPCTVCDKAFLTKQKLDEHTNGHTGNAPVKCNLCNETFRRYSNLTQHKNRHHLNIKKKLKDYICHCGEVFHTKKKLAWHKETHDEKPKACTYCNERFIHMASLTRHMRRAHNRRFVPDAQRESENVECPICKCIYLRSSLAVHMRVHNGERPYECQVCSKSFSTKWNLQLHKWTHAARSTKPFKCNQCSAAFYRHSDYTAHMNSHRNVRPYTCNYCGAQFIRKYNCLRHVKEHEENKAYTCDVCNKTFHRSYYLKEHLRVHSGARPYTCHICGKSSSTKSNHNKHVRIHHAREPVNTEN